MVNHMKYSLPGVALVVLIAFKLAIIVFYGPLLQPDSAGYITFADTILSSTQWLIDRPDTMGEDAYRMVGYPALIAISKVVWGDSGWGYAVLVLQGAVGTVAAIMVYRFAREAMRGWQWGLLVALAYALSQAVVYDVHVLTDSLYGHSLAIVIALLGLRGLQGGSGLRSLAIVSALLASLFLLREFTLFLLPVFAPLIMVAVWRSGYSLPRAVIIGIAVVLPTILFAGLYSNWNEQRTGSSFVTTGARTAALLPLVQIEGRGTPVFVGQSVLDVTARENLSTYFYADVLEINRALWRAGVTGVQMSAMARDIYLQTLFAHPLAFLRHAAGEVRLDRRAKALANPVSSFRDLEAFRAGGERVSFSRVLPEALRQGVGLSVMLALLEGVGIFAMFAVGVCAFVVFPLWYLGSLASGRRPPPFWHVLAAVWAAYAGTIAAYSLIRLEDRYLIGFGPFMIVVGLLTAQAVWQLCPWARRA
jgi:hypothetical protein